MGHHSQDLLSQADLLLVTRLHLYHTHNRIHLRELVNHARCCLLAISTRVELDHLRFWESEKPTSDRNLTMNWVGNSRSTDLVYDTANSGNSSNNTSTITPFSESGHTVIDFLLGQTTDVSWTADSDQTLIEDVTGGNYISQLASSYRQATATDTGMTWTNPSSKGFTHMAIAVIPGVTGNQVIWWW